MDLEVPPDDIKTQWQEANANRRMQFKVGNYKDSNIRMSTGTIKADWIQLPVERYLTALPTLKQGVIAGVFKIKGVSPWAITRAEKLQLSVFLPNDLSLDEWYAGVYALPTVWPDVSMLGASNLRRVVGYDFHHLRKKYDVPSMWGNIHPQWRLLQQHLETKGPGWYPLAEREERLFTNRSNRPGDDMKDELRTNSDPICVAHLGHFTEPAMAATSASSTLRVFLLNKECFPTCMLRFERKNKSYRCSSCVVSKMYPRVGERSGSKLTMVLLSCNCTLHWPLTFPAEDVVRAGDCSLP